MIFWIIVDVAPMPASASRRVDGVASMAYRVDGVAATVAGVTPSSRRGHVEVLQRTPPHTTANFQDAVARREAPRRYQLFVALV